MTKDDARALLIVIAIDFLAMFGLGAIMGAAGYLYSTYIQGIERTTEFWWNLSVLLFILSGVMSVIFVIFHIHDFIYVTRKSKD